MSRSRRRWALFVAVAALVGVLPSLGAASAAAEPTFTKQQPPQPPSTTPPRQLAPGEEVIERRTERSKTFVTDKPGVFKDSAYSGPVHYRDGNGRWADIDNTLVEGAPGRMRNKSAAMGIDIAKDARDAAVARVSAGHGRAVSFSLEGAASSQAQVKANDATYPDVFPNVDLFLSARNGGLKEDIVLKSKDTPRTFRFAMNLEGLTAAMDGKEISYRDAKGDEVLRTPAGDMVDANLYPGTNQGRRSEGVEFKLVEERGRTYLDVHLDSAWLDDPERVYPVRVDPTYYWNSTTWSDDTFLASGFRNNYDTDPELKVGTWNSGTNKYLSFMHYDVGGLAGKTIHDATFKIYENWAYSCQARGIGVYRITQGWGAMYDYPGASMGERVAWGAFAMGYEPGGCADGWAAWRIDDTVRNWTTGAWGMFGLGMKVDPGSENDNYAWKTFYSWNACGGGWCVPHIDINWSDPNSPPHIPHSRIPGSGSRYNYIPELSAVYHDPEGRSGNVDFDIYNVGFYPVGPTGQDQRAYFRPTTITADGTYWWRVRAWDGALVSDYSDYWYFDLDRTAPGAPGITSGTHPNSTTWYTRRAFSASWGDPPDASGIAGYSVALDGNAGTVPPTAVNNTSRTHDQTVADGRYWLHVRAVDGVGNWGPTTHYEFRVDTTVPTAPETVSSSSHRVDEYSSNRNIDVSWTPGTDAHSGVSRYAYTFSPSQTTPADPAGTTTTGTTARSSALADGRYWLHVRTIDGAVGNAVGSPTSPCDVPGPDAGGYRCTSVPYTWADTNGGTTVTLGDDQASPAVPLPAGFTWYGQAKSNAYISSNGYVCFDNSACTSYTPPAPPNTASPNDLAACFWEDLNPSTGGFVRHRTIGGTLVVEYNGVPHYGSTTYPNTFQIHISSDGDVRCMFNSTTSDGDGSSTAIGSENATGAVGVRYRYGSVNPSQTGIVFTRGASVDGNVSTDKVHGPFLIDATGPAAPVVTSSTHAERTWTANRTAAFTWTPPADGSPLAGYKVKFDRNADTDPVQADATTVTPTWAEPDITPDGVHFLHVRAQDAAGNLGATDHYEVWVDSSPSGAPGIASTSHGDGARWYPDNDPRFTFTADDTSGVTGFSYHYNELATDTPDTEAETESREVPLADVPDGQWYLHVRARNGAGLWSEPTSFGFKVDITVPTAPGPVRSPSHNNVDPTNQRVVTVDWGAEPGTDATSGVAGYSFAFNNSEQEHPDNTVETQATATSSEPLADGTWWFHVATVDRAGNRSSVRSFGPIVIDAAAPPVGETDTQRFLDLWVPRVLHETFWEGYIEQQGYSPEILAEGFHDKNEEQKRYLAARLFVATRDAATATGDWSETVPEEEQALRDSVYAFVFDKELLRDLPDLSSGATKALENVAGPTASLTPAPVAAALGQRRPLFEALTQPTPDMPRAVVAAIEPAIPAIAPAQTVAVPSALTPATNAVLQAIDTGLRDTQPRVQRLVDQAAADTGLQPVVADVYPKLAFNLPVSPFYAVCWQSATHSGCRDTNPLGALPVSVDVTGDGTFDVQATFANQVDLAAPDAVGFRYTLGRMAESETNGGVLRAHVWVKYDVNVVNVLARRMLIGFDGFARGDGLSESTTADFSFRSIADLQAGNLTATYAVSHTGQRPSWALTAGLRLPSQDGEGEDPLDVSLLMTPTPAQVSGAIENVRTETTQGPERRLFASLNASASFALDAVVNRVVRANDETTNARLVLDQLSTTNSLEAVQRSLNGTSDTTVRARTAQSMGRASLVAVTTAGTEIRRSNVDLRNIPTSVDYVAHEDGGENVVDYGASGTLGRVSVALTRDVESRRESATVVRAVDVPSDANLRYGLPQDTEDDRIYVGYDANAVLTSLDASIYHRVDRLAVAASLSQVPRIVAFNAGSANSTVSLSADAPIGYIDATVSYNDGGVLMPDPEHITYVSVGDALGAAVRVTGLHTATAEFTGVTKANLAVAPGGQRLMVAGRDDTLYGIVDIADMPAWLTATVDQAELHANVKAARAFAGASVFGGRRPGGPLLDLTATSVPTEVDIDALAGDSMAVRYRGTGTLGGVTGMFTTDEAPGDETGTTIHARLEQVPSVVDVTADPATKTVKGTANSPLGLAQATFSKDGARVETLAGEHATYTSAGERWGGSVRVTGLTSLEVNYDTETRTTGDLRVNPGGQSFSLAGSIDAMRVTGHVGNLPSHVNLLIEGTRHVRYEASATVSSVSAYRTIVGTGPTMFASVTDVPTMVDVVADLEPAYHVVYRASGSVGEVKGTFSPQHMAGMPAPGTGRYGSFTARGLPTEATFDMDTKAGLLHWLANGTTADAEVAVRGVPDADLVGHARVRQVPAHFEARRTKTAVWAKTYDVPLGEIVAGFAKGSGDPVPLDGRHLRFRGDEGSDNFNVSLSMTDVRDFLYRNVNDVTDIHAALDLHGAPFGIDAEQFSAAPGTPDEQKTPAISREFLRRVRGTVTRLPTDVALKATDRVVTYTGTEPIGAKLAVDFGWVDAVDRAPEPRWRHGVSVTDGACYVEDDCRPATGSTCDAEATPPRCFGVKVRVDYDGLGTDLTVDLRERSFTLIGLQGTDWGSFDARLELEHFQDKPVIVDVSQDDIRAPVDLRFKVVHRAEDRQPMRLEIETDHSRDLGFFSGQVELPLTLVEGPTPDVRLYAPTADFYMSNMPKKTHVTVENGQPTTATLLLSAPVLTMRAYVDALVEERIGEEWHSDFQRRSALVHLNDLPAESETKGHVALVVIQKDNAERPGPPGGEDPDKPSDVSNVACPSDQGGAAGKAAPKAPKKPIDTPYISFRAPEPGVDITVAADLPIVQVANAGALSLNLRDVELGVEDAGSWLTVEVHKEFSRILLESTNERTKSLWVKGDIGISTGCRLVKFGPKRNSTVPVEIKTTVNAKYDIGAKVDDLEVRFDDLKSADLRAGAFYLAYGLEGDYGAFNVTSLSIEMHSDSYIDALVEKWPYRFNRAWVDHRAELVTESNQPIRTLIGKAGAVNRYVDTACVNAQIGPVKLDSIPILTRPGAELTKENGITIDGDYTDDRMVFWLLEPAGGQVDSTFGWLGDVAAALMLEPYNQGGFLPVIGDDCSRWRLMPS